MEVTGSSRRFELDWLRVVVVLGLIPYHVAVVFAVGPGDYIQNSERSLAFDVAATLVAFIGMPLLFMIAGAATWYALGRRRASAYLAERLRRLAAPLLFGIVALVPVQLYFDRLNAPGYHLNYLQFYQQFLTDWVHIVQLGVFGRGFQYWGHLWFLLYLLAVSLFLLPLLGWLRRGSGQRYPSHLARIAGHPLGLLLLGVALSLVEVILEGPIGPRPALDYGNLYSGVAGLILYAAAFVLGYLLVPNVTFQQAVIRYRTHMLALGLLLLAFHELALALFGAQVLSSPLALALVRLLRGIITWCLLAAALGFASRYLTRGTPRLRSLSEAAFPLYVLHMPILTVLAYYVVRWDTPVIFKFVTLIALTSLVTFALYEGVVRRIAVMRFLFGLKQPASIASAGPHRGKNKCVANAGDKTSRA
jgi:peptidoglycan/LPS O-acetylase OafA/YrhL